MPDWRAQQSTAFDLHGNSTARETITFDLWGKPTTIYANANLSIYSSQACNARCAFCVEELRHASRGVALITPLRKYDLHRESSGIPDVLAVEETLDHIGLPLATAQV